MANHGDHEGTDVRCPLCLDQEDRRWYEKGWRFSRRAATGGLDYGDSINAPDAWYLGYLDAAADRPKWSLGEH